MLKYDCLVSLTHPVSLLERVLVGSDSRCENGEYQVPRHHKCLCVGESDVTCGCLTPHTRDFTGPSWIRLMDSCTADRIDVFWNWNWGRGSEMTDYEWLCAARCGGHLPRECTAEVDITPAGQRLSHDLGGTSAHSPTPPRASRKSQRQALLVNLHETM